MPYSSNVTPSILLLTVAVALGCGKLDQSKKGKDAPQGTIGASIRLGDAWDRKPFEEFEGPEVLRRAGGATVTVGPGTGFYLGKLGATHVVATNHHVCASSKRCMGWPVSFTTLGRSFGVSRFLGTWDSIELTLLAIDVSAPEDEQALASSFVAFDFDAPMVSGSRLFTSGFGGADNPNVEQRHLFFDASPDCRVISASGSYRLISDPDEIFPLPYQTWSFAIGCDLSHGDSGSFVADYATGKVMGIAWTGRFPKPDAVKSSAYLNSLVGSDSPEVWSNLNYASPAEKIRERLEEALARHELSETDSLVVQFLIERDSH